MSTTCICVQLGSRSYEIHVASGLLSDVGPNVAGLHLGKRAVVITDSNVAPHYATRVTSSLTKSGIESTLCVVPAGESSKSMEEAQRLCSAMSQAGHDRSSFVIALGGGVVGDLAGFVAGIFYRGIPFIQIPTTIVSQVDSSIGGKTGVNLPEGKNLLGVFHQPRLVLVDPETLSTLPTREYREGFAEVIKHAAIRDEEMLDHIAALDPSNQIVSSDFLARNLAIKARIVEEDELETTGTRALLNFGHTIGHAIEASLPYGTLLHGEAISLGLRAALCLSEKHAGLPPADSQRICHLLEKFQLPQTLPTGLKTETIVEKMTRDKKFNQGNIRFVLLRSIGHAFLSKDLNLTHLTPAIELLRKMP